MGDGLDDRGVQMRGPWAMDLMGFGLWEIFHERGDGKRWDEDDKRRGYEDGGRVLLLPSWSARRQQRGRQERHHHSCHLELHGSSGKSEHRSCQLRENTTGILEAHNGRNVGASHLPLEMQNGRNVSVARPQPISAGETQSHRRITSNNISASSKRTKPPSLPSAHILITTYSTHHTH